MQASCGYYSPQDILLKRYSLAEFKMCLKPKQFGEERKYALHISWWVYVKWKIKKLTFSS